MRISIITCNHTLTIRTDAILWFICEYYLLTYPIRAPGERMRPCNKRRHLRRSLATRFPSLRCFLAFLIFSFLQEPRSAQFWCSNCCPFGKHGLSISNVSLHCSGCWEWSMLLVRVAVDLISCLASVSSKFSKDISHGMYRTSPHHFRWFSRVQGNTVTLRWHLYWTFLAWS